MRRTSLSRTNAQALAVELRRARTARSLSMRHLAEISGVNKATIIFLERGDILTPQPDTLVLLAQAMQCPVSDLFAVAGWLPPAELPSLITYLRIKYPELDDKQIAAADAYVASFTKRPVR